MNPQSIDIDADQYCYQSRVRLTERLYLLRLKRYE